MSIEPLLTLQPAGKTVYFMVLDSSNPQKVFDFTGNTFKAPASAVTPAIAAVEQTAAGGANQHPYTAALDLSLINSAAAFNRYFVAAYQQAGASPVFASDTLVGVSSLMVSSSLKATGDAAVNATLIATGLDAISIADPGGVAAQTTFPKILVALWRWFYKPTALTPALLTTYKDDGVTVNSQMGVSASGTTQTKGAGS